MGRLARRSVNGGDANARLFVKPQTGYQGMRREPGTRRDRPADALIGCGWDSTSCRCRIRLTKESWQKSRELREREGSKIKTMSQSEGRHLVMGQRRRDEAKKALLSTLFFFTETVTLKHTLHCWFCKKASTESSLTQYGVSRDDSRVPTHLALSYNKSPFTHIMGPYAGCMRCNSSRKMSRSVIKLTGYNVWHV